MSKAFDKVPHHHLLRSLSAVGVSGSLLKWFESYLSNRSQKVVLNGYSSTLLPVHSGVLQGSILRPLLFIIYINSLAELHFSPGSTVILYDDILLYRPLCTSYDSTIFQLDMDLISNWIVSSGLSINPTKSSLLIISWSHTTPQLSMTITTTPVTIALSQ